MNYDRIILELMDRIQILESKVSRLEGDKAAKTALQVLFDTEYKDGSFVENKQANTCKFISDKLAMIID